MPFFRGRTSRSPGVEDSEVEQGYKVNEEIENNVLSMTKHLKKIVKTVEILKSSCGKLSTEFIRWRAVSWTSHEEEEVIKECLGTCQALNTNLHNMFGNLSTSVTSDVVNPMIQLKSKEIVMAQVTKKRWEGTQRAYVSAINKVTLLSRDRRPSTTKVHAAEQERDRHRAAYLLQSEVSSGVLADVNEVSRVRIFKCLLSYIESVREFLRRGHVMVSGHDESLERYRGWVQRRERDLIDRGGVRGDNAAVVVTAEGEEKIDKTRLFGMRYEALVERDHPPTQIPEAIEEALETLESMHLQVQGIFRISPLKCQLDEVKGRLDRGEQIDWKKVDVHTCTGVVKSFLREMPECLPGEALYMQFVELAEVEGEKVVERLRELVSQIPKLNYVLLRRVIHLGWLVDQRREENMMSASNLAVVLGPSLLFSSSVVTTDMVEYVRRANKVVLYMITYFDRVFGGHHVRIPKEEEGEDSAHQARQSLSRRSLSRRYPSRQSISQRSMSDWTEQEKAASGGRVDKKVDSGKSVVELAEQEGDFERFFKLAADRREARGSGHYVLNPRGSRDLGVSGETRDHQKWAMIEARSDGLNDDNMRQIESEKEMTSRASSPVVSQLSLGKVTKELILASPHIEHPVRIMSLMHDMLLVDDVPDDNMLVPIRNFIEQVCKFVSLTLVVLCGIDGQLSNLILCLRNAATSMKGVLLSIKGAGEEVDNELKKTLINLTKTLHGKIVELASLIRKLEETRKYKILRKLSECIEDYLETCGKFHAFAKAISAHRELMSNSKELLLGTRQIVATPSCAIPRQMNEALDDYNRSDRNFANAVKSIVSTQAAKSDAESTTIA